MGARQSVQQAAPRSRNQSTANGHAAGPSSSSSVASGNGVGRTSRSYSVPCSSRQADGSDSSDDGAEGEDSLNRVLGQLPPSSLFRLSSGTPSTSTAGIITRRTLPIFPFFDIKCPVCNKTVPSDEAEVHLVMCLTRPRITYNEDVLMEDKGECVICFEELVQGDTIARLPCLCIYHKTCIDGWFKVKNSCPEHPGDD